MAKKTAEELGLKAEVIEGQPESVDKIPDEYVGAPPPPYPGRYGFQLPPDVRALWDSFEAQIGPEGARQPKQRVSLVFDREDPLTIISAPPAEKDALGLPFTTRLNNAERNRAKRGDPPLYVSDLLYVLRAFGVTKIPKTNLEYVGLANQTLGGRKLSADLEWTSSCNPERQIYIEERDEQGNVSLEPAVGEDGQPVMGCGKRYYMNDWPRGADGRYLPRMTCKCGASLRPFGQLRNYKAL